MTLGARGVLAGMNKTLIPTLLAAGTLVVPGGALAKGKPENVGKSGSQPTVSHKCKPHSVGYVASGALAAAATLTQTAGADTPADTSDDRYSGTLSVTITKANKHARGATNPVSFTVSDIRLGEGVTITPPAGTAVKLIGKITKATKKCDQAGAGVVTVRKAILKVPSTIGESAAS
jgi:hypothetical protein